jgi:hypothetical protein
MDTLILMLIGILVACALATILVVVLYLRKPRVEPPIYFRCPSCGRKLKCFPRQSGHRGMCLGCKAQLVFPARISAHH